MRKLTIGAALGATLLACWFAPDEESTVIAPAQARTIPAPIVITPLVETAPLLPEIRPRGDEDDLGNAFAKQTWQSESPRKVMSAPEEMPAPAKAVARTGAPDLPIRVLGRFVDDGKEAWFLQVDDRNVVAYVGDNIDERYRFDSADAGALTFTYLPLQKKQVLAVGETN